MNLYQIFQTSKGICTDSRKIKPGEIFFALKGENFDGNKYATKAIELGASLVVVDNEEVGNGPGYFVVKDALKCLQDLACFHRRQLNIPILAITGTNGKTTTKELVTAVLSRHFKVSSTIGNLNNHIGVPLSLLKIGLETEIGIIEMGANHQGEIDFLCRIAEPTYGIITNVGKAHLEGFGNLEGVIRTKGELYRYLQETGGTAFINLRQPYLKEMANGLYHLVEYGEMNAQPYSISLTDERPLLSLEWSFRKFDLLERLHIHTKLYGEYNFDNLLTAIAVAWHFRVPPAQIKAGLEAYEPENNRSQIVHKGTNTFFLDAYNANPVSMKLALDAFLGLSTKSKTVILGDMLELGEFSEAEHRLILKRLKDYLNANEYLDKCVLVGAEFFSLKEDFGSTGFLFFPDSDSFSSWFRKQEFKNMQFLIKGSRGMKLERILQEN